MENTQELWKNGPKLTNRDGVFSLCMDSVLLADFALHGASAGKNICELGCGCGIISLLLAVNDPAVKLLAVDIDSAAAELAQFNFDQNGIGDRAKAICADLRSWETDEKFQTIICNPPFFPKNRGSVSKKFAAARSETDCTLDDICRCASIIASKNAELILVYRPERLTVLLEALKRYGFEAKRLRFVHHSVSHEPCAVMAAAKSGGKPGGLKVMPPMIVCGEDGKNTAEFRKIYRLEEV